MSDTSNAPVKTTKRKRLTEKDIEIEIIGLPQTPEEKKKFDQMLFNAMSKILIDCNLI